MESQLELGFKEATSSEVFGEGNYKLVPWINWDDWSFVRESLFSSSPVSIELALRRISAWRSRGCLPVIIEVTASIVEIQQKDSYFREDLSESDLLADDMLTMLYCMTIIRLVNGIVEKTRKKNEVSIGEAADVIGIPRMLIDIRHECSHRDLPSLRLVRLASTKALDWLKAYYWEPQKIAIPYPNDRSAIFGKEIKSKIRELAFCLDLKQATRSTSPVVKGKRIKYCEQVCGRCKFLSLMAVKIQSSKPSGSKKHINKALKNVVKLYSSFPSEVVSILLEFLLKAVGSADVALDDWKPLIMKLSNKVPEMLLSLLKANLHMIETQDALKHDSGEHVKPDRKSRFHQTEHLSRLFSWLTGNLNDLNRCIRKVKSPETSGTPKQKSLPKSALVDLLRKCLLVPSLNNAHLTTAASILAQTTSNHTLIQKLNKLSSLHTPNTDPYNETTSGFFYDQEEKALHQAAKKLEFIKRKLSQKSKLKIGEKNEKKSGRWRVAKSWKACPIGMLPSDFGCSGVVPVLEVVGDCEENGSLVERSEKGEGKREADCTVGDLDDSDVKKVKRSEEDGVSEGIENKLMIGGVWKRVTHDEVINMASAVRILV